MYVRLNYQPISLFRQSYLGGDRHIMLNTEFDRETVFYAETLCGKTLKYNPKYSEAGPYIGRAIRNGCPGCFQERQWEEKKARLAQRRIEREADDLPF